MNPTRILRWHYVLAAALVGHCAATSLNANAWWYGTGLFIASLLFLVALARDIVAADRLCKAALDEAARADRAARMRAWQERQRAEIDGCCERWWTSAGAEHDTRHCTEGPGRMTPKRHTASTITDDDLDALYDNANRSWRRGDRWKERALAAEAALDRVRAYATHLYENGSTRHARDGLHVLALIADQPEHTLIDDQGRLLAALHRSAWDARLIELHDAIRPPADPHEENTSK